MKLSNQKILYSFILFSIFVIICGLLFGCVWFIVTKEVSVGNATEINENYSYRLLEIDYENEEISSGIVFLPNKLEENEFVSYEGSYRKKYLISNFENERYECYGSCTCLEVDNRRNTGNIRIYRGAVYLLVAATSLLAYDLSHDHFDQTCREILSEDGCDLSSIQSSVTECQPLNKLLHSSEVEDQEVKSDRGGKYKLKFSDEDRRESGQTYFCYGNCIENWFLRTPKHIEEASNFGCENLHTEAEIYMSRKDVDFRWQYADMYDYAPPSSRDLEEKAITLFLKDHMVDFCEENSRIEMPTDPQEKGYVNFVLDKEYYLCHGAPLGLSDRKFSSKCILIHPIQRDSMTLKKWEKFWEKKERWDDKL